MTHTQAPNVDDLLARLGLSKRPVTTSETPPPAPTVSSPPRRVSQPVDEAEILRREARQKLEQALSRLKSGAPDALRTHAEVAASGGTIPAPTALSDQNPVLPNSERFWPKAPGSLPATGLAEPEVSSLILKYLYNRGGESGARLAAQLGLRFGVVEPILRQLKADNLVIYKGALAGGDYQYELTELGRSRGLGLAEQCTYFGTAPVPLGHYIASVKAQSITAIKPPLSDIQAALSDLKINPELMSNIGQAIHSGRGMFLFGSPGNGKTSIAERVTKSFGDTIWIPRCISAAGEIIRLFDPNRHKPVTVTNGDILENADGRWIHIERPTIVAGGELQMENLEITVIRKTGIGEAPLQLKANCGTLLIDDFGRQKMPVDQLLNRWIIPLEQRHDFLQLESGRSIQVPFDELIIFSTNLEPKDLVDDAFLRRIPYKIEVKDPTASDFKALMLLLAKKLEFQCEPAMVDYLIQAFYETRNRPFRYCHPRDLLRQIENRCSLHNLPKVVTREGLDQAVSNYFSIM